MGADCHFVAENKNDITLADIELDVVSGRFPGGTGCFVHDEHDEDCAFPNVSEPASDLYCSLKITNDLIEVRDGCRLFYNREYQDRMIEYLSVKCGGRVGVWSDQTDITDYFDTAKKITESRGGWQKPVAEYQT